MSSPTPAGPPRPSSARNAARLLRLRGGCASSPGLSAPRPCLPSMADSASSRTMISTARIALGADEEDVLALGNALADELLCPQKPLDGLAHIDDVNHVALAVDVRLHLGIPATDAVPEVDAGVDQTLDQIRL